MAAPSSVSASEGSGMGALHTAHVDAPMGLKCPHCERDPADCPDPFICTAGTAVADNHYGNRAPCQYIAHLG